MTKNGIDREIDRVLTVLSSLEPHSEQYTTAVLNLKELCESRSKKASRSVEPDTIVLAATNLLGILLILHYEQLNVIATKAIGFVVRGRV